MHAYGCPNPRVRTNGRASGARPFRHPAEASFPTANSNSTNWPIAGETLCMSSISAKRGFVCIRSNRSIKARQHLHNVQLLGSAMVRVKLRFCRNSHRVSCGLFDCLCIAISALLHWYSGGASARSYIVRNKCYGSAFRKKYGQNSQRNALPA